jgi:hypothetical protein
VGFVTQGDADEEGVLLADGDLCSLIVFQRVRPAERVEESSLWARFASFQGFPCRLRAL